MTTRMFYTVMFVAMVCAAAYVYYDPIGVRF
jgi:hypothetical protein